MRKGYILKAVENRTRPTPRKYLCAKCGKPLALRRFWIGNEGLLCSKHVVFRPEEKGTPDEPDDLPSA